VVLNTSSDTVPRSNVWKKRRSVIDEIAHRNVAEQNLPAANQVEEVIVGEPGERATGIVEAKRPGQREHAHGHDADDHRTPSCGVRWRH
jgi:hypothetical protein